MAATGAPATSGTSGSGASSFNWDALRVAFGNSWEASRPDAAPSKAPRGNAGVKVAYTPAMPEGRTREASLRSTGILSETALLSNELSEAALAPAPRVKEASEVLSSELASLSSPRLVHSETLIHQAGYAPSSPAGATAASPPPPAPQPAAPDGGVPPLPASAPRYALAPEATSLETKRRAGARFARLPAEK